MSEEWGPWIEHDGKGCPCRGDYVESKLRNGDTKRHIAWSMGDFEIGDCWIWSSVPSDFQVIRYRIRKPRGLTILEGVLREVEREDA